MVLFERELEKAEEEVEQIKLPDRPAGIQWRIMWG